MKNSGVYIDGYVEDHASAGAVYSTTGAAYTASADAMYSTGPVLPWMDPTQCRVSSVAKLPLACACLLDGD